MIILHKLNFTAYSFFKDTLIKTFKEKTAIITKHFWFENQNIRYCCSNDIHFLITFDHLE
ncbi:hypothetical protein BN132_3955 [Cronobacter turicensis 564]|nr:hypothetical protein BN132_3955 [Cronobacter turicensis 564]